MEKMSEQAGWQYSEYGSDKSVVIVPLANNRFQAVLAQEKMIDGKKRYLFASKICVCGPEIDLKELLLNNIYFIYSRFVIEYDILRLAAGVYEAHAEEALLMEMIMEVARGADEWENKLTGLDVN